MVLGVLYHPFHVPAAHQFGDHVGLTLLLTQVENGDDVGVRAQAPHGLGFSLYAGAGGLV